MSETVRVKRHLSREFRRAQILKVSGLSDGQYIGYIPVRTAVCGDQIATIKATVR
jgi:hypothetical protein